MRILLIAFFTLITYVSYTQTAPTYTFECVCDHLTGPNCDQCTGQISSRHFSGLLIRKNGVAHKWIDEPYTIRERTGNILEFIELLPNPDQINIILAQTPYSSMQMFKDSTSCICESPLPVIENDTLFVVENGLGDAEIQSTAPWQLPIILKAKGDGLTLSIDGSDNGGSVQIQNTAPDQEVIINQGAGISIGGAYPEFTITNTGDLSITNEGILGVMVHTDSTSILHSNTFGAYGVTFKAGNGLAVTDIPGINNGGGIFGGNGGEIRFENTAPDKTIVLNSGAGIGVTGIYPNFTIANTGDLSTSNELQNLSLTGQSLGITNGTGVTLPVVGVNAGSGISVGISGGVATVTNTGDLSATNELQTMSTASNTVTLSGSGGSFTIAGAGTNTVTTAGTTITITGAADGDGSSTNELQNLSLTGQSLGITGGTGVSLPVVGVAAGAGISVSNSSGISTVTNTGDLSATNELQSISVSSNTATLSNGGGSVSIAGAGINTVSTTGSTITVTANEVDGLVNNEGLLGVNAGIESTSVITSNSSGANGVTVAVGTGLNIAETTSSNGGTITITNSAPDQTVTLTPGTGISVTGTYPGFTVSNTGDLSSTNELQTISTNATPGNITLSGGGGTLTLNVNDADASVTNEVLTITDGTNTETLGGQTLLVSGTGTVSASYNSTNNTLTISGANTNTDAQNLNLSGQALGITGGTGVTLPVVGVNAGTGIGVSVANGVATVTNNGDLSSTNELQTLSTASNTVTLSNSGGSVTVAGAGVNTVSTSGSTITVTGTEIDGSITNEGLIGVSAGTATTAVITSNTSTANGVTISAANGIGITETTSANGGTIAIENTGDLSNTNEIQSLTLTGQALGITGSTSVTLPVVGVSAGTGVSVTSTNGVVTVTNTGDPSSTNEIQNLNLSGQALGITGGAGVTLPVIAVAAGTGISVSSTSGTTTVTNTGDTNAGDDITTSTVFTGDVTGTAPSGLTVARLQGRAISATAPSTGQALKWDGSAWAPGADNGSNWTVSGSDVYRGSGNVGIGNIPSEKLDVFGTINAGAASATSGNVLLKSRYDSWPAQTLVTEYSSGAIGLANWMYQQGSSTWKSSFAYGAIGRAALMVDHNSLRLITAPSQSVTAGSNLSTQPTQKWSVSPLGYMAVNKSSLAGQPLDVEGNVRWTGVVDNSVKATGYGYQFIGGMGGNTYTGTASWNGSTIARSGMAEELMNGSNTGGNGYSEYYHVLNLEYQTRDGSGNLLQIGLPYNFDLGSAPTMRTRVSGTWSAHSKLLCENIGGRVLIGTRTDNNADRVQIAGNVLINNTLKTTSSTLNLNANGTIASVASNGTFMPPYNATAPTGVIDGRIWTEPDVSETTGNGSNIVPGTALKYGRVSATPLTVASVERDIVGNAVGVETASTVHMDLLRSARVSATSNNVTLVADFDLRQGVTYRRFIQGNSTNTVTVTATSGMTLFYDGCSTTGGCTSMTLEQNATYFFELTGSTLWVVRGN